MKHSNQYIPLAQRGAYGRAIAEHVSKANRQPTKQHHETRNNRHFYSAVIFALAVALIVITAAISASAKVRLSTYAGNVLGVRAAVVLSNGVYTGIGYETYGWYSNDLLKVKRYTSPYAFVGYRYLAGRHEVYGDISVGYNRNKYVDALISNNGGIMVGGTAGYSYHIGKRTSLGGMVGYRTAHISSPNLTWFGPPIQSTYRYLLFGTTFSLDI